MIQNLCRIVYRVAAMIVFHYINILSAFYQARANEYRVAAMIVFHYINILSAFYQARAK